MAREDRDDGDVESRPPRTAVSTLLEGSSVGFWAAAIAATACGIANGIFAWHAAAQYLPTVSGRAALVVYYVCLDVVAGATLGSALGLVAAAVWRWTALRSSIAHLRARGRAHIVAWAFVVPVWLMAIAFGISAIMPALFAATRNPTVVLYQSGALAVVTGVVASVPCLWLQHGLAWLGSRFPSVTSRTPLSVAFAVPCAPLLLFEWLPVWGRANWANVALFQATLSTWLVLTVTATLALRVYIARCGKRRRRLATLFVALAVVLSTTALGSSPRIRKATKLYSGPEQGVTRSLRFLVDDDRDGHAASSGNDAPAKPPKAKEPPGPPPPSATSRILLITIDTLRPDHLGSYGYARNTSPTIDAFARGAVVFERAYATAPQTKQAIPSLLTGLEFRRLHTVPCDAFLVCLSDSNLTLAQRLKREGFVTGAMLDHRFFFLLGWNTGYATGFDVFEQGGWHPADGALGFIEAHRADRWFLWVHLFEPHADPPDNGYDLHPDLPSFGPRPVDRYDGEVLAADREVGRLLSGLDRFGIAESTLVLIVGDHGEAFDDHGRSFHGSTLFNEQTWVPLMIRAPGTAPRRASGLVSQLDVVPTLLESAGIARTPELDGESLLGPMRGESPDRELHLTWKDQRALVSRDWKLLWDRKEGTFELYDLRDDWGELHDRWDDPAARAIAESLSRRLLALEDQP